MPAIRTRLRSRALLLTVLAAAVAAAASPALSAPSAPAPLITPAERLPGLKPDELPVELTLSLAGSLETTPANGSAPACPVVNSCGGVNTGFCTVSNLGPCCTSGGATLCCPAGTTLKVRECIYSQVSGVVGRTFCRDRQLTCE